MTAPTLPAAGVGGATLLLKGAGAPAVPIWQPGQRVEALVVRQLAASEYLLRVDGALYAADLPTQTAPGTRLSLLFLGGQGSPRFLLLPAGAATSETIRLSTAARLLGNLLPGAKPAPLADARPILAAPTAASRPIAQALQQLLQDSGLSYESHVADWARGQRPLSALLAEPQGRLSAGLIPLGAATTAPLPPASPPPGASSVGAGEAAAGIPFEAGPGLQTPAALPPATSASHTLLQPLIPVVQQQLAYLTQGVVMWQGVLWPGQPMEWRLQVEDDAGANAGDGAVGERAWTSTLMLDLPRLGQVQARLRLVGRGVQVHLSSPRSAARLGAAQVALAHGIADAGLALEAFAVDEGKVT